MFGICILIFEAKKQRATGTPSTGAGKIATPHFYRVLRPYIFLRIFLNSYIILPRQ